MLQKCTTEGACLQNESSAGWTAGGTRGQFLMRPCLPINDENGWAEWTEWTQWTQWTSEDGEDRGHGDSHGPIFKAVVMNGRFSSG